MTGTPEVTIVADAGPAAGFGHVGRCSALAVALSRSGGVVRSLGLGLDEPLEVDGVEWQLLSDLKAVEGPGTLVLDSYAAPMAERERLAQETTLALVQDQGEVPAGAALVVDVGSSSGPDDRWLCGLRFACLRPAFWSLPRARPRPVVERVLVTTGGGDPMANAAALSRRVAQTLAAARVRLLRGPYAEGAPPVEVEVVASPSSMAELLAQTDLVVTAGGQTVLEAAACGTPALVIPLMANQQGNATRVAEAGAARMLPQTGEGLEGELNALAADAAARTAMSVAGQAAVDGRGAARVAARVLSLADG